MEKEEIRKIVENVEGWITNEEGELLYNLAKKCKGRGMIVEVGSWRGKSTIWLGNGSKDGNKVEIYSVDPFTGCTEEERAMKDQTFGKFKENIKKSKIDNVITPIVKTSKEASKEFNKPIELIFIDGDHTYEMVKSDFDLWYPKVINGGIMAFHDTIRYIGPGRLVKNVIFKSKNFRNAGIVGSITFAEKVEKNTIMDRIKNRYVLLLKNLYEFISRLYLPNNIKKFGKKIFVYISR